jgi:CheY-like chemotaxis protein
MKTIVKNEHDFSSEEDGLSSRVRLYAKSPWSDPATSEPHLNNEPRKGSPTLLVVEDDNDERNALAALLATWGYQVNSAESGKRAFELAQACRPDIAFIDLRMPDMSGYQLAASLRAAMGSNCARLFAVSGSIDRSDRRIGLFDRLFDKPINPRLMREILRGIGEDPSRTEDQIE